MAKAWTRCVTTTLYVNEFSMHNLAVDCNGLEVAQLIVEQLTVLAAASEVVDSFLDKIALQDYECGSLPCESQRPPCPGRFLAELLSKRHPKQTGA